MAFNGYVSSNLENNAGQSSFCCEHIIYQILKSLTLQLEDCLKNKVLVGKKIHNDLEGWRQIFEVNPPIQCCNNYIPALKQFSKLKGTIKIKIFVSSVMQKIFKWSIWSRLLIHLFFFITYKKRNGNYFMVIRRNV